MIGQRAAFEHNAPGLNFKGSQRVRQNSRQVLRSTTGPQGRDESGGLAADLSISRSFSALPPLTRSTSASSVFRLSWNFTLHHPGKCACASMQVNKCAWSCSILCEGECNSPDSERLCPPQVGFLVSQSAIISRACRDPDNIVDAKSH
jgi:hypothetical protein